MNTAETTLLISQILNQILNRFGQPHQVALCSLEKPGLPGSFVHDGMDGKHHISLVHFANTNPGESSLGRFSDFSSLMCNICYKLPIAIASSSFSCEVLGRIIWELWKITQTCLPLCPSLPIAWLRLLAKHSQYQLLVSEDWKALISPIYIYETTWPHWHSTKTKNIHTGPHRPISFRFWDHICVHTWITDNIQPPSSTNIELLDCPLAF